MSAEERRNKILEILGSGTEPISATMLAARLGVSRQIVVGDVALLRAAGSRIEATPRGYVLPVTDYAVRERLKCCCLRDKERICQELYTIVDHGGVLEEIQLQSPVYCQLRGEVHITSRFEVDDFAKKVVADGQPPVNYEHGVVVRCRDQEALARIRNSLAAQGFLMEAE